MNNDNTEQYLLALAGEMLLTDPETQEEYKLLLNIKKLITAEYELAYVAFCYIKYFGDGESVEDVLKCLKRL